MVEVLCEGWWVTESVFDGTVASGQKLIVCFVIPPPKYNDLLVTEEQNNSVV